MKTKKNLLVIMAAMTIIAPFIFGAFRLAAQTAPVVEKRIGNTVYELDTTNYVLKNKANKITWQESNIGGCIISFDNEELAGKAWLENFKPLFSKERAEELKVMIHITCFFDTTGQIRQIVIFFRSRENFEMFTLSEIKAMEDAIKKHYYKNLIWRNCESAKYGLFTHPFSPYLLYFESPR